MGYQLNQAEAIDEEVLIEDSHYYCRGYLRS